MNQMRQYIEHALAEQTGKWGIVITKLGSDNRIKINSDLVFPSASLIKVPIMVEVMRQAAIGSISLEQQLEVTASHKTGGAGILKELRAGLTMTVQELVTLMIVLSDNTATNMLIELVGMGEINHTCEEYGLTSTVLRRKMMDFEAARAGAENETSAADMARIFQAIYDSQGIPQAYGQQMLDILKRQQVRDKLPFYLPEETVFANKTGTLPGVEHDAGLLFLPSGVYLICILLGDLPTNYQGIQCIAKLGQIIYNKLQTGETHFAKEDKVCHTKSSL